jgi:hypothetical protein
MALSAVQIPSGFGNAVVLQTTLSERVYFLCLICAHPALPSRLAGECRT